MDGHKLSICMLANASRAWLMALRHPGDPGFSSRNPDYAGATDASEKFGRVD